MRWTLSVKIALGITTILIATISISVTLNVIFARSQLIADSRHYAMHLSEVAEAGLENAMIIKDPEKIMSIMQSIGSRADIMDAAVFNKRGEIKYSINPGDVGRTFSKNDPMCIVCHGGTLSDETQTVILPSKQGARILKVVRPIINQPRCQGCHKERVLGMLMVDLSLAEVDQQATAVMGQQIRQSLATVVIVIIALIGFMYLIVTRPLAHFVRITQAIDNGDLDKRVNLHRKDEIGELGASFDRMVDSMAARTQELERLNEIAATEITERKQIVEALRESEERFRTLSDMTPLGMCLIDIDGRYEYVNPAFVKIFGYDLSDIPTGKEWFRTAYPDTEYRRKVMADWKEDLSSYPNLEIKPRIYEVRCKGGSFRTIMFRPVTLPSGKQFIIYEDITEQKRAEEEKSRQKEIAERLAEEMAILADIGRLIGSTLDIEEVYGRFAVEVRKLIPFDRIAVNLHSPHEENVKVVYTFGETIYGRSKGGAFPLKGSVSEVLAKTKAGLYSYRTNDQEMDQRFDNYAATVNEGLRSLMGVPLIYRNEVIGSLHFRSKTPNAYGEPNLRMAEKIGAQIAGAIANAQLFSNLRKTEESLRESEERLNRAEKMEALGTLAGGVAHDLNNVLGIVVGYAELILMNADESSSIKPHLVNIMNGGMKAAAIVDDLLTLARRGVSGRDVLNLNKIIADCQQSPEFEKLYSYHPAVKIKTDLEADLSNISGSSVHLVKSLYNLVSNASEAMAKGGIVTIKTSNQYLDKPIQGYDQIRGGDYVVLSVSDTGEGIPEADLKRIFEPFYTKKVMGRSGTGLGLAVVWGTVKDHHGYINVESEEGRGSTFTLYFPVTREDITDEAVAVTISEYMGSGKSILVVDDVKEQRDLAAGMLRTLNYSVTSVSSGEEAVAYMKEHEVDLMVLDMIMDPGMDGLDTYRSVLEIRPQQKAIIVSGFSESDRVKTAKDLGAGAYVRKPYIIEKLGLAVRKELDRST